MEKNKLAKNIGSSKSTVQDPNKLSIEEAQTLYKSANPTKIGSAISAAVPLAKMLFTPGKKSAMDNRTKNQLAVALTYYKDKINTVDSLNDLGEHGTPERSKKLSPIGYKHEGLLSGQNSNVNVQDVTGNALSRVLGSFGTVKDKDGNFLIDDDYDNEIYRIPKEEANRLNIKGLRSGKTDPNHYIVPREKFDKLREAGVLKDSKLDAIKYTVKSLVNEVKGNPEFSDESWSQRLKKIGENAIVRTGTSQKFDFVMSDKERARRVRNLQNKQLGAPGMMNGR